ncbi:MAG: exosortase/archaeosortase family protein [Candidatus Diapherotrites archaeon]|uniref:Exosortase/archaeosortase family protein n=1 Tax=Candidatus Iainarchaeum sp. TaxID=3101447 RepID=A0A8T4C7E0_9ARCH|nr:exosortase/archaeosortase family protein [Candidatus Diapherotrites archaeon]
MEKNFLTQSTIQRFVFRFFIIFGLVEFVTYYFPPLTYQEWLAALLGNGLNVSVNETLLFVNGIVFEITPFCTGLSTWGLLLGLIYGFDVLSARKKILYALAGWVIIFGINILRLLAIVYVGKTYHVDAVDTLHTLTWFVMSAIVLWLWLRVLMRELNTTKMNSIAQSLLREH